MDADERYQMNEEARIEEEFPCTACGEWITGYDTIDPIVIEDEIYCDRCAGDLTTLRMAGHLGGVAIRTKDLVKAHDRALDQHVWENILPWPRVRHI